MILDDPEAPSLPAVPTGAVIEIAGNPCVFYEEKPGVFRPVAVNIMARSSNWIGLGNPVKEGQRLVVGGAALLLAAWENAATTQGE